MDEIIEKIQENSVKNPKWRATLDRQYKTSLDSYTNDINKLVILLILLLLFTRFL